MHLSVHLARGANQGRHSANGSLKQPRTRRAPNCTPELANPTPGGPTGPTGHTGRARRQPGHCVGQFGANRPSRASQGKRAAHQAPKTTAGTFGHRLGPNGPQTAQPGHANEWA
eukprot:7925593-Pyramimonas_sp.AAC.2